MLLYAFHPIQCPSIANSGQIVGFLAAGLTYSTSIVNDLVYSPEGDKEAAAAGFILLSMVMVSASFAVVKWLLTYPRLCGSYILAQHLKPRTEAISTPLPCTKSSNVVRRATADPSAHTTPLGDKKQPTWAITRHKYITLHHN